MIHKAYKLTQFFSILTLGATLSTAPLYAQHEADAGAGTRAPIHISGNENAYGYSQMAMMAMMQAMERGNRYARGEGQEFVAAIAEREQVPANWVLPTAGSGPFLVMTALAYAAPGKNMITVTPGYLQLSNAFERAGGEVKSIPVDSDLKHDLAAIKAAIDENTVLIYICNPNNPTGTIVNPVELMAFIRSVPKEVLVFVDEAYLELSEGGLERNSMIGMVRGSENILLARTFSKVFGMAGLRIGYGIGNPALLQKLQPYNMGGPNLLALVAGTAALADVDHQKFNRDEYMRVRKIVTDKLDQLGVTYAEPHGSFVFIKTGIDVTEFQGMMAAEEIFVGRPFPPMLDWCRVSIGTEEEMRVFLTAFERIMRDKNLL